jgi:hypothetical protein
MVIKYYENGAGRYRKLPFVRALFAANLLFAVATLVAWQSAFLVLLTPLAWATGQPVPTEHALDHLFAYPLILFWLAPAMAMATAWVMIQERRYRSAFGILALPMLVFALCGILFWVLPNTG